MMKDPVQSNLLSMGHAYGIDTTPVNGASAPRVHEVSG